MEPLEVHECMCDTTKQDKIYLPGNYDTKISDFVIIELQSNLKNIFEGFILRSYFNQSNTLDFIVAPNENISNRIVNISTLHTLNLNTEISVVVEPEGEEYIARCIDFPLYALGNDLAEAIDNLRIEIETLYYELQEDDNFSDDWLNYKRFLNSIIVT